MGLLLFFLFSFFFISSPHLRGFSKHSASLVVSRKSWPIGALRFARGFKKKCFATPLHGLSRHFASLVFFRLPHSSFSLFPLSPFLFFFFFFLFLFQKKLPATNGDFDFFFQKSACYLCGFLFFFQNPPDFET